MKRFNTALYLATVASCAITSTAAFAQAPGPNDGDSALHGTGATSIQNLLVQELNCTAGVTGQTLTPGHYNNNNLGNANNTFTTVAEPAALSSPAGTFDCSSNWLKTDFNAKYVGTGSGFGRQAWRSVGAQFSTTPGTGSNNPFALVSGQSAWTQVQFAFADSSITASDLSTYNAPSGVASKAGAGIMIPKFVLPVAVAYNPTYGHDTTTNVDYTFNVVSPGSTYGGIKLTTDNLCLIFNGGITNWNDTRLQAADGNTSLMDPDDNATRWTNEGAPIRLVGRLETSGTTDIFTRALAAQCAGKPGNRFANNAESLPYNSSSSVNLTVANSATPYRSTFTGPWAGTTNSIGRQYFASGAIQDSGTGPLSNPTGAVGSGLFLTAQGSGGVRDAINLAPDYKVNPTTSTVTLNGKVGYIGADYLANSVSGSSTLFAAALQRVGSSPAAYIVPNAAVAVTAVGSALPPQSNTDGSYNASAAGDRADPLSWYNQLYPNLAAPTLGYPITGTTQFLGYSCYKPSNYAHIRELLLRDFDDLTISNPDASGADRSGIFTNTSTGLLARSNIGAMPPAWKRAVRDTFLADNIGRDLDIEAAGTAGKCSALTGM